MHVLHRGRFHVSVSGGRMMMLSRYHITSRECLVVRSGVSIAFSLGVSYHGVCPNLEPTFSLRYLHARWSPTTIMEPFSPKHMSEFQSSSLGTDWIWKIRASSGEYVPIHMHMQASISENKVNNNWKTSFYRVCLFVFHYDNRALVPLALSMNRFLGIEVISFSSYRAHHTPQASITTVTTQSAKNTGAKIVRIHVRLYPFQIVVQCNSCIFCPSCEYANKSVQQHA